MTESQIGRIRKAEEAVRELVELAAQIRQEADKLPVEDPALRKELLETAEGFETQAQDLRNALREWERRHSLNFKTVHCLKISHYPLFPSLDFSRVVHPLNRSPPPLAKSQRRRCAILHTTAMKKAPRKDLSLSDRLIFAGVGIFGILFGYGKVLRGQVIYENWRGLDISAYFVMVLGLLFVLVAVFPWSRLHFLWNDGKKHRG
jgi:hypothetical protein